MHQNMLIILDLIVNKIGTVEGERRLYDQVMSMRIFTLINIKIIIRAP